MGSAKSGREIRGLLEKKVRATFRVLTNKSEQDGQKRHRLKHCWGKENVMPLLVGKMRKKQFGGLADQTFCLPAGQPRAEGRHGELIKMAGGRR